ncbi:hypothetical protein JCM5353_005086 [Sporobolomyces roseus]
MIPTAADRKPNPGEKEIQVNQQGIASASGNATTTLPASDVGGRTEHANQQQPEGQFNKQIHPKQLEAENAGQGTNTSGGGGLKPHQA